jgi:ribosomal protein L16 Arg81 hydroxylase
MQLEGVKHWRLYERTELLPLATDKVGSPELPLGAAREVCLKPGDLLYIPRGHVHDAHTSDIFSLHLTVGINVYRWADLIHHAVACISRKESRFRELIPGGALPAEGARFRFSQYKPRADNGISPPGRCDV